MRFDVVTLFPAMFAAITEHGITRRAYELGLWSLPTWNPRDFTTDAHRTVDDRPYGGGPGMVMMAEPLALAIDAVRRGRRRRAGDRAGAGRTSADRRDGAAVGGAGRHRSRVVCGRYEGIDQRFLDVCVDEVVSVGDFVMSGGELAAMALIDAVVRQLPGALKDESVDDESFATGLLDGPHYTRPESVARSSRCRRCCLSGHHRRHRGVATARGAAGHAEQTGRSLIRQARAEGRLTARDESDLRELAQMGAAASKSAA